MDIWILLVQDKCKTMMIKHKKKDADEYCNIDFVLKFISSLEGNVLSQLVTSQTRQIEYSWVGKIVIVYFEILLQCLSLDIKGSKCK